MAYFSNQPSLQTPTSTHQVCKPLHDKIVGYNSLLQPQNTLFTYQTTKTSISPSILEINQQILYENAQN